MSMLISADALRARRAVAAGPLAPLARSLAAELAPLLHGELSVPTEKAVLSREGGRCARDGAYLTFDPFQPHAHRCPRCGEIYRGERHDRFWLYWYHLWLAERAVHAALLARLDVEPRGAGLAGEILTRYADAYLHYPNVDNVLGPARLFFSTYLESIWLLQICVAADLLREADPTLVEHVCARIVEPGRALIAQYDEGGSNRQVWTDVALLAAARLVGDEAGAEAAVYGTSGLVMHLANNLLADGSWYEGENYHLFAHRGLWYGVTMAEVAEIELSETLIDRFAAGFRAPFATMLPDLTLPARRDSQYAISLRQWRIAEHCELGLARGDDPVLVGALARLYDNDVPRGETGRRTSSADVERNAPASALTRADLGWRGLLCARPALPPLEPIPPASALMQEQGIAVFRREDGRAYAALDYGHGGGGHGHPDRLNVLLASDASRWLDDYGTGSYVDPSLHWYRSTLAHNAPLVDGRSQDRVHGSLGAYDERGGCGWVVATAAIAPGVTVERTLVVMPTYAIDVLRWDADRAVTLDLPLHVDLALADAEPLEAAVLAGGAGEEDGFAFAHDAAAQHVPARTLLRAAARVDSGSSLAVWARSAEAAEWWRAIAPGPPERGERAFRLLRAVGVEGRHDLVWSWGGDVADVAIDAAIVVTLADGSVHEHRRVATGWHVDLRVGEARSSIDLAGLVEEENDDEIPPGEDVALKPVPLRVPARGTLVVPLGETHYRRSEQSWAEAGEPAATIGLAYRDARVVITVDVARSDRCFPLAGAENPYDNEPADVNGDSVQLYVRAAGVRGGWMLVPETGSAAVRVRGTEGWTGAATPEATWEPTADGYRLAIALAAVAGGRPDALDVIVNEKPRGRERRRGQLVLSGAEREFVYLRGDRHDVDRLVPLLLPDV